MQIFLSMLYKPGLFNQPFNDLQNSLKLMGLAKITELNRRIVCAGAYFF